MDLYNEEQRGRCARFRPRLEGCVARDRQLSQGLQGCYVESFAFIAASVYRSLVVAEENRVLCELFEWMAEESLEEFRLLGELILALGGDAEITRLRVRPCGMASRSSGASLVEETACRLRKNIDRYETLMSHTGDRVVRSILAKLLSGQRRMLDRLQRVTSDK